MQQNPEENKKKKKKKALDSCLCPQKKTGLGPAVRCYKFLGGNRECWKHTCFCLQVACLPRQDRKAPRLSLERSGHEADPPASRLERNSTHSLNSWRGVHANPGNIVIIFPHSGKISCLKNVTQVERYSKMQ